MEPLAGVSARHPAAPSCPTLRGGNGPATAPDARRAAAANTTARPIRIVNGTAPGVIRVPRSQRHPPTRWSMRSTAGAEADPPASSDDRRPVSVGASPSATRDATVIGPLGQWAGVPGLSGAPIPWTEGEPRNMRTRGRPRSPLARPLPMSWPRVQARLRDQRSPLPTSNARQPDGADRAYAQRRCPVFHVERDGCELARPGTPRTRRSPASRMRSHRLPLPGDAVTRRSRSTWNGNATFLTDRVVSHDRSQPYSGRST